MIKPLKIDNIAYTDEYIIYPSKTDRRMPVGRYIHYKRIV